MNISAANIVPFGFEDHTIRTLTDENGEPLFVAKDIAVALGYKDAVSAIKQHCKGVVIYHPLRTPGGLQEIRVIKEPDVYRLIIKSTLPSAVKFEEWLMEEVLPAIRKTGGYQVPMMTRLELAKEQVRLIEELEAAEEKVATLNVELDYAHEWATIKRVEHATGENYCWRKLKAGSVEIDRPRKDIFDANYGTVKSYHADLWKHCYGLDLNEVFSRTNQIEATK